VIDPAIRAAWVASLASQPAAAGLDLDRFANGHAPQLEVLQALRRERRVLLMMARQTGKSWSLAGGHIDRALWRPGSTNLAFGLTGPAVRNVWWEPVWKPACRRWGGVEGRDYQHVETTLTTRWGNGSRTLCTGTDDVRHIQNVLGGRLDGSLVTVDEMQSQGGDVVRTLLGSILPPMLTGRSTLVLAGTLPEVPGGPWWDEAQKPSWWQRSWGRLSNVHTPEASQTLEQHLADNALTVDDPQIQRDWFGNRNAFDPNARAYFYRPEVNGYTPPRPAWLDRIALHGGTAFAADPWPGVTQFSAAIDPGAGDPMGVTILGWGPGTKVQHLFDWVSRRDARLALDVVVSILAAARDHLGGHPARAWQYRYDTNSQNEIQAFSASHGIPSIKAATKVDMPGQIRRMNNELSRGQLQVIVGSNLEQDMLAARLDQSKLGNGQWHWKSQYHPTASECARYALAGYWDTPAPVAPSKPLADPFAEEQRLRKLAEPMAPWQKRNR